MGVKGLRVIALRDRSLTVLFGCLLGASWIVATVAAEMSGRGLPFHKQPAVKYYALGWHPWREGPFIAHLFGYSFIHGLWFHLITNLACLWWLISWTRNVLTPKALIHLYLLGTVTFGIVYLAISHYTSNGAPLIGGGGSLMAVFGAAIAVEWEKADSGRNASRLGLVGLIFLIESQPVSYCMLASAIAGLIQGAVGRDWMASQGNLNF